MAFSISQDMKYGLFGFGLGSILVFNLGCFLAWKALVFVHVSFLFSTAARQ